MGVNCLPKTVTRQRRDCDLYPGPSASGFNTLTTRLPSHPNGYSKSWHSTAYLVCVYNQAADIVVPATTSWKMVRKYEK